MQSTDSMQIESMAFFTELEQKFHNSYGNIEDSE